MGTCRSEARSNISTASTAVWSRSTEAPRQAEYMSGNITNAEACKQRSQRSYRLFKCYIYVCHNK